MKIIALVLLFPLMLVFGCAWERGPSGAGRPQLSSEEYLISDPSNSSGFTASFKKQYRYDRNKLSEVVVYEYNPAAQVYDSGYVAEEYHYANDGRLSRRVSSVGTEGIQWIEEYEYPDPTSTKVTRYESGTTGLVSSKDWWLVERTPASLNVKYYQLDDELYAQLSYSMDEKGNVVNVTGNPSFPVGTIYYRYDDSPNPHRFSELSGEYGADSQQYISENNAVEITNDSSGAKSVRTIEYLGGLPITITTATSKTVLTYR